MTLEPGLTAAFRYTVSEADTPRPLAVGEVPMLATPRLLALVERATVVAVASALEGHDSQQAVSTPAALAA